MMTLSTVHHKADDLDRMLFMAALLDTFALDVMRSPHRRAELVQSFAAQLVQVLDKGMQDGIDRAFSEGLTP